MKASLIARLGAVVALAGILLLPASPALAPPGGFDHRPVRFWSFSEVRVGEGPVEVAGDSLQGGRLDESISFGPAAFDIDGTADGRIFSSAGGRQFEVVAQAPIGEITQPGSVIGGISDLDQYQSFEKRRQDATIEVTIADAFMDLIDTNGTELLPTECPPGVNCAVIDGYLTVEVRAYTAAGEFFQTEGAVGFSGWQGHWKFSAATMFNARSPLWDPDDFDFTTNADGGTRANALNRAPISLDIDLSSLDIGELFAVNVNLTGTAISVRGRESSIDVFLRDLLQRRPSLVETSGLRTLGEPPFPEPPDPVLPVPPCPLGPHPNSGTVQFSEPEYVISERPGAFPQVLLTRTGGSTGAASVSLTTSDGSARAGDDYTAVGTIVSWADGDDSPRLVEVPITHDGEAEPDETVQLSISESNCIVPGQPTEAQLTIVDDDRPVEAETFTIGGTVTGLEGSGLQLANLGGADQITIDANGPFQFPTPVGSGLPYDVTVVTQPNGPDQVCTVTSGSGTVNDADITDILVECITPAPPSGLDQTFGDGGRATTPLGEAEAVAIQPDGGIVTAGNNGLDFALTRHDADGVLDPGFGSGGIVTTNFGGAGLARDEAFDVAVQPDGKIVAVGSAGNTSTVTDFAVARYNADGTPDADFGGGDGLVTTDFGVDGDGDGVAESGADIANGVVVQPDGKIVVAGHAAVSRGPGLGFQNDFAVARYNADGTPDADFGGGDGHVTTQVSSDTDLGHAVALQPDGGIVVGGEVDQGDDFALVRYLPDGSVDASFGGGEVITDFGGPEAIKGVTVQPDGRIVVAGRSASHGTTFDVAVARYDTDGSLDTSFGGLGSDHLVTTDVSGGIPLGDDFGEDVAVQADGHIVVVGRSTSDTVVDMALVRYDGGGGLDTTFATDGVLTVDFHGSGDFGQDVAIQRDGKLVAAGFTANGNVTEFALARVLP